MQHVRILGPAVLCLALTACAGSTAVKIIEPPPPSLTQACQRRTQLPERELTQLEVETYWGRDRGRLTECANRHAGLSDWALAMAEEAVAARLEKALSAGIDRPTH